MNQNFTGPRLVSFNGRLLVIAGERGFTPDVQLGDVWSSDDGGSHWAHVTDTPGFSPRSGHGVLVTKGTTGAGAEGGVRPRSDSGDPVLRLQGQQQQQREGQGDQLLLIAGWPELHDVWRSADAKTWSLVGNRTWNCGSSACGKFDFWSVVAPSGRVVTFGGSSAYSTFGKLWADTWEYVA